MAPEIGRTLAVDYGARRVGLAVADALGLTTRPLDTIDRRRTPDLVAAILAAARAEGAVRIVVGIPRLSSGDEGPVAAPARALARALAAAARAAQAAGAAGASGAGIEVLEVDEGDTSREAGARLAQSRGGRGPRRRADGRPADKGRLDAAAAAVLLEGWLAAQREHERGSNDDE